MAKFLLLIDQEDLSPMVINFNYVTHIIPEFYQEAVMIPDPMGLTPRETKEEKVGSEITFEDGDCMHVCESPEEIYKRLD